MKVIFIIGIIMITVGIAWGIIYSLPKREKSPILQNNIETNTIESTVTLVDFSKINPEFLFSAEIPNEFEAEYMPNIRAINVYDPNISGKSNIEKSQVYITFFKAGKFLTLRTVEITQQDKVSIKGKDAILYEITKKDGVPSFSGQPVWRNFKHKAIDIRYSKDSPSYFYSFAQNPSLPQKVFDDIMNSFIFINN